MANHIIEEKNKHIAELEKRLENAIVPKFKIGQAVWAITYDKLLVKTSINSFRVFAGNEIEYYCKFDEGTGERIYLEVDEECVFATKEEAEQKLAEIKKE